MVIFDTGTNFPAVRWNPLLAVAMRNIKHRWNWIGFPTQSHPNAASLTHSAWNIWQLMLLSPSALCSCTFNLPASWQAGVTVKLWRSKKYPQSSNFVTKSQLIGSHQVGLPQCSLLIKSYRHVHATWKEYLPFFFLAITLRFVMLCTHFHLCVTFCLQIYLICVWHRWPEL